jgi:hypothetical protein
MFEKLLSKVSNRLLKSRVKSFHPDFEKLQRVAVGFVEAPTGVERGHHVAWAFTRAESPYTEAVVRAGGICNALQIVFGLDLSDPIPSPWKEHFAVPERPDPVIYDVATSIWTMCSVYGISHEGLWIDPENLKDLVKTNIVPDEYEKIAEGIFQSTAPSNQTTPIIRLGPVAAGYHRFPEEGTCTVYVSDTLWFDIPHGVSMEFRCEHGVWKDISCLGPKNSYKRLDSGWIVGRIGTRHYWAVDTDSGRKRFVTRPGGEGSIFLASIEQYAADTPIETIIPHLMTWCEERGIKPILEWK